MTESPGGSHVGGRHSSSNTSTRDDARLRETIQLAMLPGLGPRTLTGLLNQFGSAGAVLQAGAEALHRVPGIGPRLAHTIRTAGDHLDVNALLNWCKENGTSIVPIRDPRYPKLLAKLVDAPPLLFVRGDLLESDALSVAIVGTRHASPYGLRQAERIAFGLAQAGVTVVSGLARGIDTAAHRGALDAAALRSATVQGVDVQAGSIRGNSQETNSHETGTQVGSQHHRGGRTIAVLGSGLGEIYPPENSSLAAQCSQHGAVLSEHSPHTKPRSGLFPQRNRLIAGITLATLVIEAPQRSGSLITARLAQEQNRDVLALPGQVNSRTSSGCHDLIRDGATLIRSADDVLEAIGPMATPVNIDDGQQIRHPAELQLNEIEQTVLQAIHSDSTLIDQVIVASGLPTHRVISTISVLEMKRLVRRLSGQYVSRI
ncbi:MAG: DNA-processing protein DprA [Planctomycetota bacterium]